MLFASEEPRPCCARDQLNQKRREKARSKSKRFETWRNSVRRRAGVTPFHNCAAASGAAEAASSDLPFSFQRIQSARKEGCGFAFLSNGRGYSFKSQNRHPSWPYSKRHDLITEIFARIACPAFPACRRRRGVAGRPVNDSRRHGSCVSPSSAWAGNAIIARFWFALQMAP